MTENIFNLETNRRYVWVDEIKKYTGESMSNDEVIQFCLSYTLQSLRRDKDDVFNEFKWDEGCYG